MDTQIEQLKEEIKGLKQQLSQPLKSETRTVKGIFKIFFIALVIISLLSIGLNLWMLKNNDWHLQKVVWWSYQPYVVTQSFFDEKLSIERQDGYNQGYGLGHTEGGSEGHNVGYNTGYSAGVSVGYNEGYNNGCSICGSSICGS